jgi:RNA polymerase sigma-70 factor, ECF subfamily
MTEERLAQFEAQRSHLMGIAYRMLGEMGAAEDVVQEAWLRWNRAAGEDIRDSRAWLSAATVRLALDALRKARARRESYVGPWLPEPLLPDDTRALAADAPAARAELASDLSLALLLVLERLSPEERAALILHDAFDCDYAVIAQALEKNEAACRKLVSRARERVKAERPRHAVSKAQHRDLVSRFVMASAVNDAAEMARLLKPDAVLYSDGGGKAKAALNPIFGADRVLKFAVGVMRKFGPAEGFAITATEINGVPGFLLWAADALHSAVTIDADADGIRAIYLVRNPEKLRRIGTLRHGDAPASEYTLVGFETIE